MLMCRGHWFSLSKRTQRAIWREYREGQEIDKKPSLRYLAVQRWSVGEAILRERKGEGIEVALVYLVEALKYRAHAITRNQGDPLPWMLDA